eukprot:gene31005-biopygen5603
MASLTNSTAPSTSNHSTTLRIYTADARVLLSSRSNTEVTLVDDEVTSDDIEVAFLDSTSGLTVPQLTVRGRMDADMIRGQRYENLVHTHTMPSSSIPPSATALYIAYRSLSNMIATVAAGGGSNDLVLDVDYSNPYDIALTGGYDEGVDIGYLRCGDLFVAGSIFATQYSNLVRDFKNIPAASIPPSASALLDAYNELSNAIANNTNMSSSSNNFLWLGTNEDGGQVVELASIANDTGTFTALAYSNLPVATETTAGIVQIVTDVSNRRTDAAASAEAVRRVYDRASSMASLTLMKTKNASNTAFSALSTANFASNAFIDFITSGSTGFSSNAGAYASNIATSNASILSHPLSNLRVEGGISFVSSSNGGGYMLLREDAGIQPCIVAHPAFFAYTYLGLVTGPTHAASDTTPASSSFLSNVHSACVYSSNMVAYTTGPRSDFASNWVGAHGSDVSNVVYGSLLSDVRFASNVVTTSLFASNISIYSSNVCSSNFRLATDTSNAVYSNVLPTLASTDVRLVAVEDRSLRGVAASNLAYGHLDMRSTFASNLAYGTSNTVHVVSIDTYFASNLSFTNSLTAVYTSNLCVNTSNVCASTSNLLHKSTAPAAVAAMNASFAASNIVFGGAYPTALFASNTACSASNLVYAGAYPTSLFASNVSVTASNTACSASNLVYAGAYPTSLFASNAFCVRQQLYVFGRVQHDDVSRRLPHVRIRQQCRQGDIEPCVPKHAFECNIREQCRQGDIEPCVPKHAFECNIREQCRQGDIKPCVPKHAFECRVREQYRMCRLQPAIPACAASNLVYINVQPDAIFASNASRATSNLVYLNTHSNAVFGSNTACAASNLVYINVQPDAIFASNASRATSNLVYLNTHSNAVFGSNTANATSNLVYISTHSNAVFGSNAANAASNLVYMSTHSNAIFGSNAANAASNLVYMSTHSNAVFGSNVANATSNLVYMSTHSNAVFGSNVAWSTSNMVYSSTHSNAVFGSNTAWASSNLVYINVQPDAIFASNASRATSNLVYLNTHSNAVFRSNTACAASNLVYINVQPDAIFASNASRATSNLIYISTHSNAVFGSNVAWSTSNMVYRSTHSNAVFGSNTAWAASNHVYLKTHPDAVFGSNAAWATSNQVNLKTHPDAVFGSNTACGTSNHVYLKTHPDAVFGSNAGGSAYNIAINCSNLLFPVIAPTALLASNVSFTCSNTLFGVTVPQASFASNHSHWASNTSLASSNFLFANLTPSCFFSSNLAHKTSVVAAYTSNVVNETLYPMASFASNNSIGLTYLTNPTIRAFEDACVLFATPAECSVTLSNLMDGGNLSLRVSDVKGASLYSSSPKGLMSIGVAASSVTTRLSIDIEQSCAVNGLSSSDVGFVTTTGALAFTGEWVDIVLPDPITLGAYSISPIISTHTGQPRCFVVLGRSSDGESWQVVDTTYATTPYPVTGAVITVTSVPPSLPSSRFRIVLTRVRGSSSETETRVSARVGQVRLFGEPSSHSFLSLRHDTCLLSTRLGVGVSTPGTSAVAVSGSMSLSGRLGVGETLLGTEPAFSLQLVRDSAAKPSSSTWTVTSDRRIKENICNADLERCYEIVREVPLRRFSWRKDVYTPDQVGNDRSKLGWIAQEVQAVFPKAVSTQSMFGMDDCLALNNDQLIAALYGCVKCMQARINSLEKKMKK